MLPFLAILAAGLASSVRAVTVYSQQTFGAATTSAAAASYTGAAAYDPTVLNAPAVPNPAPATQFSVQLQSQASAVQGLSIPQSGSFLGFSIEMSVINQILGSNSSFVQVPFLNLMSNLATRGGHVNVRVGGNTQDFATLVDSLADGKMMEKDLEGVSNPTQTPPLLFTPDVLYLMNNISSLVNVRWYLGIPLNDSQNLRLGIAEAAEQILGDNLLGFQVGNEPDLYADHGHRAPGYSQFDYFGEFGSVIAAIASNDQILVKNNLIGPNLATGDWTPEMVWDTGFITSYSSSLGALGVEHYPDNNCAAQFGTDAQAKDPQTVFSDYLNHTSGQLLVQPYLNSTGIAQGAGKPFIMFETNSASCGGFPGVSNSYGSALWMLDYGMQMAHSNFSGAHVHIGGQNVYYNPFTPPPTNQSTFHQWTIGPIYYASMIIAEAFGNSNQSQIIDMFANDANMYTPAYAIYDNGSPSKVALFNYITDSSGASNLNVAVSINGATVPSSVKVKRLSAESVSTKSNITWAGQTFGGSFESDGRLVGDLDIETVNCDTGNNVCQISVPAPGFALVFLSDDALTDADQASTVQTFSTTAVTKTVNTATIDASVLATSNGHSGKDRKLGSTSKGSSSDAPRSTATSAFAAVAAMAFGAIVLVGRTWM
ncbi:glycoside hydrolase family 79 protein [Punctularia strigosozonata HHB-11173 SS5]|uniref:Glycoside hydrolase family 79 protein n=1 Tax=Punctularia strigosozonata (strain HHB-11173) TaxID=741275 RepID=R7S5A1_PUNST|nr:glycoside hydrolase family 79 protein [Punctularia strigosozonata HHB-11173 SS5]EIN05129.1 glycoside hydrolase family 79 protein [Punctularia strigosozonata HHB-11173 SS5]